MRNDVDVPEKEGRLSFSYLGPSLDQGPMPAIFYFALSKEQSLSLDPYNQPALFLSSYPLRIFSISLPCHGENLDPTMAIPKWAEYFQNGKDILAPFLQQTVATIEALDKVCEKIAFMGLSRGAFIACHVAAKISKIKTILGFAPLTKLSDSGDFARLQNDPLILQYNLENLADNLCDRELRFYISNYDRRVGTENAFSFIHSLAKSAYQKNIRSAPIELIIRRPIGYLGHGTPKKTFEEGAAWLAQRFS